jgi:uncharacterized lipoprotein YmbA
MKKISILLALLLGACSFGGYSKNSTFYMMNSENLSPVSEHKINVGVSKVNVPDLLNKPQMVVFDKDSQTIEIKEFERWGEPLPYVLQNTVTNDLQKYLPNAFVKSIEYASETLDYTVKIKINKIEAYEDDKVILSAWWHIEDAKGKILKRDQGTYEAVTGGDEISDLVKAQNRVVHDLSRDIALALSKI